MVYWANAKNNYSKETYKKYTARVKVGGRKEAKRLNTVLQRRKP
jgi:hypothetical protein